MRIDHMKQEGKRISWVCKWGMNDMPPANPKWDGALFHTDDKGRGICVQVDGLSEVLNNELDLLSYCPESKAKRGGLSARQSKIRREMMKLSNPKNKGYTGGGAGSGSAPPLWFSDSLAKFKG